MRPKGPLLINVRNLQRTVPVNVAALQKFAEQALPLCLCLQQGRRTELRNLSEISVLLISDRRMAALHSQFLGRPGPTDVITFEHGEIFISVAAAKRHARRFNNLFRRELELYILHGLLHLHGFDDRKEDDARTMAEVQERVLTRIGAATS
jgi:probable rRNA maturation factor